MSEYQSGRRGRISTTRRALVALMAAATISGGCASSHSAQGSASGRTTLTIGLLTDLTGPGASSSRTSVEGVRAGLDALAKPAGYSINFVTADTESSPGGALSAVQKLVEEDHVFAVVAVSGLTFLVSSYLTAHDVPVVGVAQDGPEWITAKNMFSVFGPIDFTKVTTTMGEFLKMEGATVVGTLGYGISPASSGAAEAAAASARAAGLKVGYVNTKFPLGSTDVTPVALQMKAAGVNAVVPATEPNTNFALITALRQEGAEVKAPLLATGYGGDLTEAGPGAIQSGQNVYFFLSFETVEMNTPATRQLQAALRRVGVTTDPTYSEYAGYTSMALLVDGLRSAGTHPTQASLIQALSGIKAFTAAGLFGSRTLNLGDRSTTAVGVDNCYWVTKLDGNKFALVPGADPICGHIVTS
jgi:branched-chain amino acid transport system substrate-binding protein